MCERNIKGQCFLHSYMYHENKNIYKFIKNVEWKKMSKPFICCSRLKTAKLLATAKQLTRKNSVWRLKNYAFFFHRANIQKGLNPPHLICSCSLFKDPPALFHSKRTLWMLPNLSLSTSNLVSTTSRKIDTKYLNISKSPSNTSLSTSVPACFCRSHQKTLVTIWQLTNDFVLAGKFIFPNFSHLWLNSDLGGIL